MPIPTYPKFESELRKAKTKVNPIQVLIQKWSLLDRYDKPMDHSHGFNGCIQDFQPELYDEKLSWPEKICI